MMEKTLILKHISRMLCLLISYSKFTRTETEKTYTDILQNDIIIISKKIKQRIESVLLDTKKKTIFIQ